MKIAFDLDDILAEFNQSWLDFYNKNYHTHYTYEQCIDFHYSNFMTASKGEITTRIYEFFASPQFANLEPVQEGIELVEQLKVGNELVVLTSRDIQFIPLTLNWVKRHYPNVFKEVLFTNQQSSTGEKVTKADVCIARSIDFLIEDAPHHAFDTAEKGIKTIMPDRPWNKNFKSDSKNLIRIKSLLEIPAILTTVHHD